MRLMPFLTTESCVCFLHFRISASKKEVSARTGRIYLQPESFMQQPGIGWSCSGEDEDDQWAVVGSLKGYASWYDW